MNLSTDLFEQNRRRLTGIAYGMLGSVMDAEDVVQDAYLKWVGVDPSGIDSPAAFLTTTTTRLAIDRLRSARVRREQYVGPWLPEPVITSREPDPANIVEQAESLSLTLLQALERLNPVERAVLLLRDVFDYDYVEIADIVDKSPANCRQIAKRARDRAGDVSRPARTDLEVQSEIITRYIEAVTAGDVNRLSEIFTDDVVLWADGGGVVNAARHPLHGAWRVARHLVGVQPQTPAGTETRILLVNGEPSIVGILDGKPIGLIAFEIREKMVTGVRAVLNPEKLAHLGTL